MIVRIIQVGMGGWGRNWTRYVVSRNTDVELVACVDPVPAMQELSQKEITLPANRYFTSLSEALARVDCDAVLITTSLEGHVPSALTALAAGKHVLLEKPFAPTIEEAQQVVAAAQQQNRVLMISQNYRFFPAVQAVRELVRQGMLGPLGNVSIDFRRYANTAPKENHKHYTLWQPLLVDMSIHHFDLMRYIFGQEASQIFCQTWNPPWSNFATAPAATAAITFDGGTIVNYQGSWVSPGPQTSWSGEWRMEFARGEVIWESRGDTPDHVTLHLLGEQPQALALPEVPLTDRHGSLHAFVQAIRTGQEPESSGRDNLQTLALMLAAVKSATDGSLIKLQGSDRKSQKLDRIN
ncbi:MAG: Gfo/Idh/MocA family oxidoreductase [Ktedonobacteraceae bacterium]|nr:Gfo/Idh/MocA family oxidoreductase [Ktedonobacteraceae bacterium]